MIRALLPLILLALMVGACSSSRQTVVRPPEQPGEVMPSLGPDLSKEDVPPEDSIGVLVRRLETDPLAPDAPTLRRRLFAWMVGSERLGSFDAATTPIDDLQNGAYRYREELLMQYMFGSAVWNVGGEGTGDIVLQQEAGVRSMIAAYKNIAVMEPGARDSFLDKLDEMRRGGTLRYYLRQKNRGEGR